MEGTTIKRTKQNKSIQKSNPQNHATLQKKKMGKAEKNNLTDCGILKIIFKQ